MVFSRNTTMMRKFRRSAAECLVAGLVLVSLTAICYRLHINIAIAGLLFVVVVVIASRVGSFASSIVAAIIAAICLSYIAPPAFSFRVDDPFDVVAIFTVLVASFVIAGLVSKVRQHAEVAVSSVSYRVIEAEEHERQRIASDLHEDIGQRLTLLISAVKQLKTDMPSPTADVTGRIDAILKQSSEILTDVKALAHELYSPRLEYLGIAGVMSSFCRDFGKRKGVEIDFRSDGSPNPVPQDIALCLLRVLQEALLNAAKHSGVRQFDLRFSGTSDEIHLAVSDCGVGLDLEAPRRTSGLGLNRMQERLKLVKGQFAIDSQRQIGTTIHARVPLNSKTNSAVA